MAKVQLVPAIVHIRAATAAADTAAILAEPQLVMYQPAGALLFGAAGLCGRRPLISSVPLGTASEAIRSLPGEPRSRLKWKKLIFVPLAGFASRASDVIGTMSWQGVSSPTDAAPKSGVCQ